MALTAFGRHSATRWLQLSVVSDSEAIKRSSGWDTTHIPPLSVTAQILALEIDRSNSSPGSRVNSAMAPNEPTLQPARRQQADRQKNP
jgi:hypothetical protein